MVPTRISVEPTDAGFAAYGELLAIGDVEVFLDGVKCKGVVTADEAEGFNGGASSGFNYARRREDHLPKELLWDDVTRALRNMGFWDEECPRIHAIVARQQASSSGPFEGLARQNDKSQSRYFMISGSGGKPPTKYIFIDGACLKEWETVCNSKAAPKLKLVA
jgi:hypothetical protein